MIELVQQSIVLRDQPVVVVAPKPETIINVVASQGAKGEQGLTGPEGKGAQVEVIAGDLVGGHRIVGYDSGGILRYASNNNLDFASSTLGLTLNAALAGATVTVATNREVQHSSWNWIMTQPIYLGVLGQMTQVPPEPPAAAFLLQVGFPTAPDKMWVEVEFPIFH